MVQTGIVGCFGSLGSQLVERYQQVGIDVVGFDISKQCETTFESVDTVDELLDIADIVHWCSTADSISTYPTENRVGKLVLHDSVMSSSLEAKNSLMGKTKRGIDIVHMIMNSHETVDVAIESDDLIGTCAIFDSLGFRSNVVNIVEHDNLMAQTQAIYAILHEILDLNLIKESRSLGLLPPSGEELVHALENRAANWKPATINSLMKNPHIEPLLEKALNMIRKRI